MDDGNGRRSQDETIGGADPERSARFAELSPRIEEIVLDASQLEDNVDLIAAEIDHEGQERRLQELSGTIRQVRERLEYLDQYWRQTRGEPK